MKFLNQFNRDADKLEGVTSISEPPRYWYSTGNYVLNRIISKSFYRGVPQGRITALAGPSGSGKSFSLGNVIAQAQKDGTYVLMIDSENAFDEDFATALGINCDDEVYNYKSVITIDNVIQIVSSFLKAYRGEYGDDAEAPRVLIAIDSLDMLLTSSEATNFAKGDVKGDQGQKAKQLKAMLKQFVQAIKGLNVTMVVTTHVYAATQDQILKGEGTWVVNGAVRFALSQIALITKLKLKDKEKNITGIRMKCEGFKTRFTKPFQTVTIEVPYDTGIDPLSGLIEVATAMGVIEKKGSRYFITGVEDAKSWYAKDIAQHVDYILEQCEADDQFLEAKVDGKDEYRPSKDESEQELRSKLEEKMNNAKKNKNVK